MSATIQTAARQYANRPQDERFPSLDAMIDDAIADKNHSGERTYNLKDLHVAPVDVDGSPAQSLELRSPNGGAQGATRASQESGYQDERYQLDRLAAQVLARGAKLVRV